MQAPPQVRGHHLLCLLTYVGRGYSPAFVRAMDVLAAHVAHGGSVQLCVGPDVLCASLTGPQADCQAHCHLARNAERDRLALDAIAAQLGRAFGPGAVCELSADDIDQLRQSLQTLDAQASLTQLRAACGGCEWLTLCQKVTTGDFAQTRIPWRPQAGVSVAPSPGRGLTSDADMLTPGR